MACKQTPDPDLIAALREGRHDALTEIFTRYWKPLYVHAYQKLRSHEQAEEIVQDLFTELWDRRERLFSASTGEQHLSSYLRTAIRNKILNHIRRKLYDQRYWEYCRSYLPSVENTAHHLAEYNDLQEQLNTAVSQLSDRTKEIFVLHKLQGVPVVQISRSLKLSEKAVGYHLTKSTRVLRDHLKDFI